MGTSKKGEKAVLIKRMVKFSNLNKWLSDGGLSLIYSSGFTPNFKIAPKFFKLLNEVVLIIFLIFSGLTSTVINFLKKTTILSIILSVSEIRSSYLINNKSEFFFVQKL